MIILYLECKISEYDIIAKTSSRANNTSYAHKIMLVINKSTVKLDVLPLYLEVKLKVRGTIMC